MVAVYLIMVGMHFIGLSYILVYVGAISILFLFIIMLMNIRMAALQSYTGNSIPLALIFSMILYYALSGSGPSDNTLLDGVYLSTSTK